MATLDATTQAEYAAEVNASDRAQAVVDALTDPVYGRVYSEEDMVMGEGAFTSPWATVSDDKIIPTTLNDFFVLHSAIPNDGWRFKIESGSRYLSLTFGLSGSGKEAIWSSAFDIGTRAGILSGEITASGNRPPVWSGAPSALSMQAGATQSFASYVSDPDDDPLVFSLVSAPSGYSITTAGVLTVGSTSQSVTIRATDPDGLTADTTCAISILSSSNYVKWNPGHYAETQTYNAISSSVITGTYGIASMANVEGVQQRYNWSTLEPTRGGYDFSAIDADLAKLRPYGKRLIPLIMDRSWSGTSLASLPTYLRTEIDSTLSHNITLKPGGGVIANIWLAPIMDRLIALVTALLAEYDDEPLLEIIQLEEITPGGASTNGYLYSTSAMITQWRRLFLAAHTASQHTLCAVATNTLGGVTGPLNLIEYAYQSAPMVAVGGPDIIPPGAADYQIAGDRVFMRNPDTSRGDNPSLFIRDYRGTIACREGVQTPSLGGKEGTFYPAELAAYGCTTLGITHFTWVIAPTATNIVNWENHIYPYLQGSPLSTASTFPSRLTAAGKVPLTGTT